MRQVINKLIREEDLYAAVDAAFSQGWKRVKLYFLIGLPTETDEDTLGIVELAKQCVAIGTRYHKGVTVTASVGGFVPKVQTPFQWFGQNTIEELTRKVHLLRDAARPVRGLTIRWHDPKATAVEGIVSRGDRRMGAVIEQVWREGGTFQEWSEHFDLDAVDRRARRPGDVARGHRLPSPHRGRGAALGPPVGRPPPRLPLAGLDGRPGRPRAAGLPVDPLLRLWSLHRVRHRARGGLGGAPGGREPGDRPGSLNRGPSAGTISDHGAVRRRFGLRVGRGRRRAGRGGERLRCVFASASPSSARSASPANGTLPACGSGRCAGPGCPLAYTEGFSPRPQLSFGLALPTGCESLAEYLDVVLDDAGRDGRRRRGRAARTG